jgi:hypothetical protein
MSEGGGWRANVSTAMRVVGMALCVHLMYASTGVHREDCNDTRGYIRTTEMNVWDRKKQSCKTCCFISF